MEGFISYIIKSSSILLLLYGYYWLFLREQTFFTINRFYLLFSLLMGMILPLISIELSNPIFTAGKFHPAIYMEHLFIEVNADANVATVQASPQKLYFNFLLIAYLAGVLFFLIRYLVALTQILFLIWRNPQKSIQGIHIVKLRQQQPLFSFFNYLFVYQLPASKEDRRKMFEHEKKHILQMHSFDLLITELACITNWFNPLVWLFKDVILENHEYIADRQVIHRYHTGGYPELLIRQAFNFKGCFSFTNYFACSKLKKRIMMMTKKQTSKSQVIRYIPAFVLTGILFYGICCNIPAQATEFITPQQQAQTAKDTAKDTDFRVVEKSPQFPEDNGNPLKWITKNLKYPEKAMKEGKMGKVYVNFIIDTEGNVINPKIIKGVSPEIDAEALRVIRKMPKWKPGYQDGKAVKVSYNIPITFWLCDDGTTEKTKAPEKMNVVKNK